MYDLIQTAEWLLETANISPEWERRIRSLLYRMDSDRLARCVEWLRNNQHEPVNPAKQNAARWVSMGYWKNINDYKFESA
jgi:hypothetical protein